jgi:glycosyltransferase involved in cell wall biosynthesis
MSDGVLEGDFGAPVDGECAPTVSVVICAYTAQRWPQIVRAVESVHKQEVQAHQVIVVIDHNAELFDRVKGAFPEVSVVSNMGPRGLSAARNTGVAHARGDIVAFLDDDAEAEPDWLARLLPHYADPSVLAVGGHAEPAWEAARPRWLPPEFDWVVGCSFAGQPRQASPVRNVIGCNMSFRRAVLDRIDGFTTSLGRVGRTPIGCEETELCIRMQQLYPNAVVLYEPAARVSHRVTADRGTWSYFHHRCLSEGRSKAVVARLVGRGAGLSAERDYIRHALPGGIRRGLRESRDGDRAGLLRSGTILAGLFITASGYVAARVRRASHAGTAPTRPRPRERPAPVRVLSVELSEGVPDLPDGDGPGDMRYGAAQVLVRLHGQPLGLLSITLPAGGLTARALAQEIADRLSKAIDEHLLADGLPPLGEIRSQTGGTSCPRHRPADQPTPFISVVVPTCGRTRLLGRALDSLAALDYPCYEVVVVDNAPHDPTTARYVAQRAARDARVRYTSEPRAGVTHARNRGLAEAGGEIVAFADDDVTVDRQWLRALVDGFTDEDVASVTGEVLASELETSAQIWVEQYGGFGKGCRRRRFDRDGFESVVEGTVHRVAAAPGSLYPYLPGAYGSGANMAFRAKVLRQLGGFDPLLGSGAVRTGEDIDVLMRLVLAGHTLLYEPAAIVWHSHHRELRALRRSVYHYGVGLSAVMVKCLATETAGRRQLLTRLPRGIAHVVRPRSAKNDRKQNYPASLTVLELCGMVLGPAYYAAAAWSARSRRSGR